MELNWSTRETIRKSVRIICDDEGLPYYLKNQLTNTVQGESGFNIKAVNRNYDGSSDYGIAQFNTRWYIGPGKPIPSIEVALNDPEFCIRVMCKQFLKGRQRDWYAWRKLYGN